MIILGLDPSLSCTGYGLIRAEGNRLTHIANGQLKTDPKALEPVLGEYEGAKLAWRPQMMVEVNESDAGTLLKLIDTLDEDDDVQTVWGNYDVSDEIMEKLG